MSTSMHRLQISLPRPQFRYLVDQARREGVSMAEILRRLIRREAETRSLRTVESYREIIGIGQEREPLIDNIPVSEQPDLYIAEQAAPDFASGRKAQTSRGRKRGR
jgi:hypothetical protein